MNAPGTTYSSISPFLTAIKGTCPRCGKGKLFHGFLELAPSCSQCGLDYTPLNAGDGPAVFVSLIGGFIVLGLALWMELTYEPPFWVHILLFFPLTILICGGLLRPLKALLVAMQYKHKAEPGRIAG
ncbi:DUF983 domain-containing protein [Beijerinckia mobilis]|uniref:DUF983 domain-containing protein n=1 Tax=Beijerinckia mobilis TaxID=231434 RepID=UPI00054FD53E|nr:DUF983 domain-containing protein [Beijerinckia mobilis]